MSDAASPGPSVERLGLDLSDRGPQDPMTVELIGWLAGSSRFRAFAETYRDKIHKKLRNATDPEAARDVRAELQIARLLLADRRFEVAFEAYGSGKVGPDLTVSFRSTRTFDVEVTRLRRVPDVAGTGAVLMAKLRQLTPSTPNVRAPGHRRRHCRGRRCRRGDPRAPGASGRQGRGVLHRPGSSTGAAASTSDTCGSVPSLVWCEGAVGDARATLWTNRSARIALPDQAARACLACLRAS